MPRRPPRCTSGDKQNDCKGRVIHLLARDDQGHSRHKRQLHHLQWHRPHPNQPCPPPPRRCQHTHSNMYVETSFTTWEYLTWSWWTDIHTGPSSPHPGKEPRDSSIPYGIPSPLTGIPDSITSDGGPEFVSHITRAFLKDWNVRHRISSAYHPHANCRAEVDVKSMKRLIAGNTGPGGTLTDSFHKAMLTYRNNPDPETKSSPAMCVFGRPTRDLLPGNPTKYVPPPHLDRHAKPQRESTVETIHSRKGQMGRAHSRPHATEGRRRPSGYKTRLDATQPDGTRQGLLSRSYNTTSKG